MTDQEPGPSAGVSNRGSVSAAERVRAQVEAARKHWSDPNADVVLSALEIAVETLDRAEPFYRPAKRAIERMASVLEGK